MKKMLSLVLLLATPFLAQAQRNNSNPLGANLTLVDAGTCSTNGSFVWQILPSNAATTTINLAGTFTATVTFRLSNNGGGTWTASSTSSSVGTTAISTNGFTDVCADVTAFTSGTINVTISTGLNTGPQGPPGPGGGGTTSVSSLPALPCTEGQTVFLNTGNRGNYTCTNGVWVGPSPTQTGSVNPSAFGAKFDGRACFGNVDTITITNTSNQITCNHANWSASTDNGKQFTASNGCCGLSQNFIGVALFSQIGMHICKATDSGSSGVGVVNATTANICKDSDGTAQNATSSCSGSACIIAWATNDDTAFTAAETAWQTAGKCGSANFSAGITALLKGHFNNPGASCLGMEPQADYTAEVDGEGMGVTVLGLFSGFDFTTCTGGGGGDVCFGGYLESVWQNLQANGFGIGNTAAATAKKIFGPGLGSQWTNVGCMAFGGSDANLIGFSFDGNGVRTWGAPIVDGCGKVGCFVNGTIAKIYYGFCGDTLGANVQVQSGADITDYGSDYGVTGGTILIDQRGRYHGVGVNLFSCSTVANATGMYMANGATALTILDGARWNCTSSTSNGAFLNQSGQKLILTGGTQIGGTTAAVNLTAGTMHITRDSSVVAGLITGAAAGTVIADAHSLKGTCTGVGTAASTLGLYGTGPNVTLTTCTSTTIGSGVPIAGAATALSLRVTATAAGTNASSGVVTVLKNGGATTITCTIGTGTSCLDSTHSVAFADGDLISIQFTTQAADTLAGVKAAVIWQ